MGYLVFALRLFLGALLLVAGVLKAHDGPSLSASSIAAYRLLPPVVIAPLGTFLPYFEIFVGGYLVVGLFTRIAASVAAAQFALFAAAVASLVVRGLPADCGCFGSGVNTPPSWLHVAADLLLAVLAGLVAWRAPGFAALDQRLGTSGSFEPRHEV
ncbi:MAG: MauE/DoxX family redox-associated membrane protein [Vulcanimicrobiaceae bacterium]